MAGLSRHLLRETGNDGRNCELRTVSVTLVGGTMTALVGVGWDVVGLARVSAGVGALGNLTASVAGDTLTVLSDAATDISTVTCLLAKGGTPPALTPS